mmetsp:Transcript_19708/g.40349  ORF Transcript_19708/g.40349 Transcript_19708/m.40349 type:complete len:454 (-) Transcript_19708:106-1467(-)
MISRKYNLVASLAIAFAAIAITLPFMIHREISSLSNVSGSTVSHLLIAGSSSALTAESEQIDFMQHEQQAQYVIGSKNDDVVLIPCTSGKGVPTLVNATQFWEKGCKIGKRKSVRFFHIGKGGGGTVEFILGDYRVSFHRNHPGPNFDSKLLEGPTTTLLINIRDPVDRFVSAFNWRSLLHCGHRDKRKKFFIGKTKHVLHPSLQPNEVCFGDQDEEKLLLHDEMKYDPNVLAEALCEDSPGYDSASTKVKLIHHANLALTDWFDFVINPKNQSIITPDGVQTLMAITTEPRVESNSESRLDWHTQQAVLKIYADNGLNNEQIGLILKHKPQLSEDKKSKAEKKTHSSTTSSVTNIVNPIPLRKLGECCLARYFRDDYRLIKTMLPEGEVDTIANVSRLEDVNPLVNSVCNWGSNELRMSCLADLESMLHRRALFLEESRGSCQKVVANLNDS